MRLLYTKDMKEKQCHLHTYSNTGKVKQNGHKSVEECFLCAILSTYFRFWISLTLSLVAFRPVVVNKISKILACEEANKNT